ncbi:MAG: DUF4198 domain-containing protein [Gammaproteobacteria bacterium]|nr:DUF4198 domain-containing protein [Gammaproteobacteria bacterium]
MIFTKHRQFTANRLIAGMFCVWRWSFIFWVGTAQAHDFWIEPERFRPALGDKVPIHLYVGMDFKGDSAPFIPEWFQRYVYVGSQGEKPVPGSPGDDPAGIVPIATPGLTVIGYRSTQFSVTFDTLDEFEKYLLKEGLERNLALAKKNKSASGKIVENYYRCAKSLVMAKSPDTSPDRLLGFRIELMAEKSPYVQAKHIPFRLLYENHPLAGSLVVAFNKAAPLEKLKARTDKNGRVHFDFNRPGTWLVTSVHMIPAPAGAGAQWESAWASLSFERP